MRKKFLFFAVLAVISLFVVSACGGAAPTSEAQVLGPVNYDSESMTLQFSDVLPTPQPGTLQRLKLYPAVSLAAEEAAICQTSGNEPQFVPVDGIGYHEYPNDYCVKISTALQTYVTMHDVATECTGKVESSLCRDEVNRLQLINNATATANLRVKFVNVVNEKTAPLIHEIGGFEGLMEEFNRQMKDGIRLHVEAMKLDPNNFDRNFVTKEISNFVMTGAIFDGWKYKEAFKIVSFEVTYLSPDGLDTQAAVQANQENQEAASIATQWAISCSAFPEASAERLVCQCNYNNAKNNQSASCTAGINIVPTTPTAVTTPAP